MSYSIEEILNFIKCPVICIVDQEQRKYTTGSVAYNYMVQKDSVQGKNLVYELQGIIAEEGEITISLKKKLC